jgi:hypothetical protein
MPVAIARRLHFGISMIPAHHTESKMSPATQGSAVSGSTAMAIGSALQTKMPNDTATENRFRRKP